MTVIQNSRGPSSSRPCLAPLRYCRNSVLSRLSSATTTPKTHSRCKQQEEVKVGEVIRRLQQQGWQLVATRGSHRQFKHPVRTGRVTVAGKASDDLAPGALKHRQPIGPAFAMSQSFAVVIEEVEGNFSAYVPDLPGCVATGETRDVVLARTRDAIAFHLEGLAQDAQPTPPLKTSVATVLL